LWYCWLAPDSGDKKKEGIPMKTSNLFPTPPRVAVYCRVGTEAQAGSITGEQSLLDACRAGKYDHILVKSYRHLARSTQDLLRLTREVKSHGISVRFENEGLVV
jgi:hypothetical protein